jgi:hypothetical protein
VARRHAHEHGAGQDILSENGLAGHRDGETARRGHAEGVHCFADEILAEHRPLGGPAVAAAGIRGSPRPLELDVEPPAIRRELLDEQVVDVLADEKLVRAKAAINSALRNNIASLQSVKSMKDQRSDSVWVKTKNNR